MFILGPVKITRQVLVYSNFFCFCSFETVSLARAVDDRKEGGVGDLGVLERIEIFKGYWLFCNIKKPDVV